MGQSNQALLPYSPLPLLLLSLLVSSPLAISQLSPGGLSPTFYARSCPRVETIVAQRVAAAVRADSTIAGPLLRLLFHDCFVRGCDASIMLNGVAAGTNELAAVPNQSVRGGDVIEDVKHALEATCPRTVSCADIIALSAREVVRVMGGPVVRMRLGRRDGTQSFANDAAVLPSSHANVTSLLHTFSAVGLNLLDLVTLSGAHTIGRGLCTRLQARFNPPDNTLVAPYRNRLQGLCGGAKFNPNIMLQMDPITPQRFDNQYYKNLMMRRGLFTSDQSMAHDARTINLVKLYANNQTSFFRQFAASLRKMSEIQVLTGNAGQVRQNCRVNNGPV